MGSATRRLLGGAGGIGALQLMPPADGMAGLRGRTFRHRQPLSCRPSTQEVVGHEPQSGYGPGTLVGYSGTIAFDVYRGDLSDWNSFGINFNYDGYWGPFWASTSTDFIGGDGRTWTHCEVPFTINATAGVTYFGMGLA